MTATMNGAFGAGEAIRIDAAAAHIAVSRFDRPTLVVDRGRIAQQYDALAEGLGEARIHYAVKANPAPEIIAMLVQRSLFNRQKG